MSLTKRGNTKFTAAFVLAIFITMLTVACGSDSGAREDVSIPRVVASDRIYTVDDLKVQGVKTVKSYKVDELPGALAAWNAIYNQLDYEARFYASHEDAVAQGTLYADSVTGDDAVVTGDDVLWQEGKSDRRKCSRAAQAPHSSCSYSARYLEYVIRGNMILFCEGDESSKAFENCEKFLALTEPA
ncbi:MAG: hypothetical protein HQ477_00975 [Chloroflexi bacterium]|mgnify:CR=1 FL=1|nr:hypothetical protein [Chloroflexota bacterium]